ncbi:hypothetical protein ACFXO9_17135 [Nocardia tengchongensis]|uniref:hypothetical protein n=1 Tax=Nocardia tengchongensis TaxID=2055889 RepID=UPI0036B7C09F
MSELRSGVGDFDYPTPDPTPGQLSRIAEPLQKIASRNEVSDGTPSALEPVAIAGCESEDIDAKLLADPLVATG